MRVSVSEIGHAVALSYGQRFPGSQVSQTCLEAEDPETDMSGSDFFSRQANSDRLWRLEQQGQCRRDQKVAGRSDETARDRTQETLQGGQHRRVQIQQAARGLPSGATENVQAESRQEWCDETR